MLSWMQYAIIVGQLIANTGKADSGMAGHDTMTGPSSFLNNLIKSKVRWYQKSDLKIIPFQILLPFFFKSTIMDLEKSSNRIDDRSSNLPMCEDIFQYDHVRERNPPRGPRFWCLIVSSHLLVTFLTLQCLNYLPKFRNNLIIRMPDDSTSKHPSNILFG